MRSHIVPGGTLPDYELFDHTHVPRKLSELQGDDPLILTLARGHYYPKEHQQHLELAAAYPKIAVAYTRIATISTDEDRTSQEFRNSVGAPWPFLSDPGRIVQQDLDIQPVPRPARRLARNPSRLGPGRAGAPRGVGLGRLLAVPRLEQARRPRSDRAVTPQPGRPRPGPRFGGSHCRGAESPQPSCTVFRGRS
ncbi:redoxin domain-containing protein [Streptomyces sp. NPDC001292]|uniref:redoxin domain-containing protein n=1 Tax=Streptomyces sp. NPDC001292 TaxID=3364558 RepID=UPI0036C9C247